MLRINQIKNVNNTLKNQPVFKAGVQTNYNVPAPEKNIVEDGLFTVFTSKINEMFSPQVKSRAKSIEAGLNNDKKFDAIA